MKIGTDIVKIDRMENAIKKEHFKTRVFTENEIAYCKNAQSFAGLFAAKEAYLKALGCGIDRALTEVEIAHDEKGKPYLTGVENSDVSIAHDGEYAIATVLLW